MYKLKQFLIITLKRVLFIWICIFVIIQLFGYLYEYNIEKNKPKLDSVLINLWNWRYKIGLVNNSVTICDTTMWYGCLQDNIISYKIEGNTIYVYYYFNSGLDRFYYQFWIESGHFTDKLDKSENLLILNFDTNEQQFYSKVEDIKNEHDRVILQSLINNPVLIINEKKYIQ